MVWQPCSEENQGQDSGLRTQDSGLRTLAPSRYYSTRYEDEYCVLESLGPGSLSDSVSDGDSLGGTVHPDYVSESVLPCKLTT